MGNKIDIEVIINKYNIATLNKICIIISLNGVSVAKVK